MRDTITSPRVEIMKRKRRAYKVRLSILLFILLTSIIFALAYFSFHVRVTLQNVAVSGTRVINMTDVETRVREDFSGKYLRLFSKANSFIYPHNYIYNDLLKQFPRIKELSVYRDNLTTLHIGITERAGSYLYCGKVVPEVQTDIGENCYFINDDGYIFDKAPYFSGNVYFKYYMSVTSNDNSALLGSQVIDKERFHALTRFKEGIEYLGFKPIYLVIEEDGAHTMYLNRDKSTTIPKIIFRKDDDLVTILDNLNTAMSKKEFANEINSKYSTLLYIDLRFNNKVVYKFQE